MSEDVLAIHSGWIGVCERELAAGGGHYGMEVVRDLAAALRAERERVIEIRAVRKNLRDWLEMYRAIEIRLQSRVAELEPDAKLGRMVREMPVYCYLWHEGNPSEPTWTVCLWPPQLDNAFVFGHGGSPVSALEDVDGIKLKASVAIWVTALEAAGKGETC